MTRYVVISRWSSGHEEEQTRNKVQESRAARVRCLFGDLRRDGADDKTIVIGYGADNLVYARESSFLFSKRYDTMIRTAALGDRSSGASFLNE